MRPRPVLHETEAEPQKVVSRTAWCRDPNIPGSQAGNVRGVTVRGVMSHASRESVQDSRPTYLDSMVSATTLKRFTRSRASEHTAQRSAARRSTAWQRIQRVVTTYRAH